MAKIVKADKTYERKGKDRRIFVTRIVVEHIDRGDLVIEKRGIEEQLATVLSDEELLAWAKENHPGNRVNVEELSTRLSEINELLEL